MANTLSHRRRPPRQCQAKGRVQQVPGQRKATSKLERIGDYAGVIAKIMLRSTAIPELDISPRLNEMGHNLPGSIYWERSSKLERSSADRPPFELNPELLEDLLG